MKSKILAVLALSAVVALPAAFAQQSGDQPASAQPAAVTAQSGQVEVTGTIASLTGDRIEVKVDGVTAPEGAPTGSTVMVGSTSAFALDSSTEMPQGLKVGDRIDLWFAGDNGALRATKLALAVGADQSAGAGASSSASSNAGSSSPADQSSSPAAGSSQPSSTDTSSSQSTASSPSTGASPASPSSTASDQPGTSTEPSSSTAAPADSKRAHLPKTGSPLPLIGLLGLAALASVFLLRFVVKV